MWRIAADTGGTFTDCHAITPDGTEQRVKVLSSGCLRTTVMSINSDRTLRVAGTWEVPMDFFRGFQVRELTASTPHGEAVTAEVLSSRCGDDLVLELVQPIATAFPVSSVVELNTGEAAPVIGARLLTKTPPGAPFPPLDFRLATTRATNALLERKGTRVAFFITQGFGDLLLIGDQRRRHLFALMHEPREVHYETVCEVPERLDAHGDVLRHVNEPFLHTQAVYFIGQGITTAAVAACTLVPLSCHLPLTDASCSCSSRSYAMPIP